MVHDVLQLYVATWEQKGSGEWVIAAWFLLKQDVGMLLTCTWWLMSMVRLDQQRPETLHDDDSIVDDYAGSALAEKLATKSWRRQEGVVPCEGDGLACKGRLGRERKRRERLLGQAKSDREKKEKSLRGNLIVFLIYFSCRTLCTQHERKTNRLTSYNL